MVVGELEADLERFENQKDVRKDNPRIHPKLIHRPNRHLTSKLRRLTELNEAHPSHAMPDTPADTAPPAA